jgi:hypothetical protein
MNYTTLRLDYAELIALSDSIQAVFPENLSDQENAILDRLSKRISKALYRLEAK